MQTNIHNITSVSLLPEVLSSACDHTDVCASLTNKKDGGINTASQHAFYLNAASVAAAFGISSSMYAYAATFFGAKPSISSNWNGAAKTKVFVAGYWNGASKTKAEAIATLKSAINSTLCIDTAQLEIRTEECIQYAN
ncbi:MAG: hypothetical protein JKY80_02155 [Mariprofundaceae bacterium]|nr:hypothetical protein [Methylophaga sp.]MBL4759643.1 hypothetical protein [Mariprofundaceae bacterium]